MQNENTFTIGELRAVLCRLMALGDGSVSVAEAAKLVRMANRTVYRWRRTGKLERMPHGRVSARSLLLLLRGQYGASGEFDLFSAIGSEAGSRETLAVITERQSPWLEISDHKNQTATVVPKDQARRTRR